MSETPLSYLGQDGDRYVILDPDEFDDYDEVEADSQSKRGAPE